MALTRFATSIWRGSGADGKGALTTQSGALSSLAYSANARFVSEDGKAGTNPEELVAAAHAGCFAMALSFRLTGAGHPPEELKATSRVTIEKEGVHWSVTGIHLDVEARVPGMDDATFQTLAQGARDTCPISKALTAVPITLAAKLV